MLKRNGNFDFVRERIEHHGKDLPNLKLARIIYKESPLRFSSVDHVRTIVRAVFGQQGGVARNDIKDKSLFMTNEKPRNPYNIPASDETVFEPFVLEGSRVLVLSDIHVPYHSVSSLTAAFKWAIPRKPDTIVLNGDTIDCHMLSRFTKEPEKRNFASELKVFGELITSLRKTFPKARIIYKEGNHDERYNHFLMMKASELVGVEEFALESIIKKRAGDVDYVGGKRIIKAGELNIIHGHEFGMSFFSPVNPARGLFLRAKVSCLQGHLHQTSEHTESNMNGRITTTWSSGCLSELHPMFLPINKWNNGFAYVEVSKDGDFDVQNKRIYKGEVL